MTTHPHIEDAFVLRIADLLAAHATDERTVMVRRPALPWREGGGQEVVFRLQQGEADGAVELIYAAGPAGQEGRASETVALVTTRPHLGGLRWWFQCGVTGKRASKLYLFPGQYRFCHRTGLDLMPTYLSQRVSGPDKVYRRLWALRCALLGQGSILEALRRPQGMHLKTYAKLLQRDAEIRSSPDNPLTKWLRSLPEDDLEDRVSSHII